jgi:negative regulator of flagellin synthesis FlgM
MKIGNSVESASVATPTGRTAPADADKSTPLVSGPAAASTQVELSSTAATLRAESAKNATQASADFDAEKVNRISQSIADGSFTVNPEAIADKLISNAQELLSKRQV